MKRYVLRFIVVAAVLLLPFEMASAGLIYDNGSFNSQGGSEMSEFRQADDFALSSAFDLDGIRFWSLELPSPTTPNPDLFLGSISWEIATNAGGEPGSSIGSGNVSPSSRIQVGSALDLSIYQYDLTISLPSVAAGTYWLILHNGPSSQTAWQDFYWAWTDLSLTNTPTNRGEEFDLIASAGWNTNDAEHAFQISGTPVTTEPVPEPATLLLVSGGLIALRLRRKPAR